MTDNSLFTFIGVHGSDDDPTCNGDPLGTARASVRFVSETSGEDTGGIALPCENWSATGKADSPKRGFSYKDSQRLDGPCGQVKVQGQKAVSVSCDSKGPHPF